MAQGFDAYHVWLGIPPEEQPPDCYRLLGIPLFEDRPEVVEHAADQRMAHLKSVGAGKHTAWAHRLLNEVAGARVRLLDPYKRAMYDRRLREELGIRDERRGARDEGKVGQASLPAEGGQAFLPAEGGQAFLPVEGGQPGRLGRSEAEPQHPERKGATPSTQPAQPQAGAAPLGLSPFSLSLFQNQAGCVAAEDVAGSGNNVDMCPLLVFTEQLHAKPRWPVRA
jgi:hypothetical protein